MSKPVITMHHGLGTLQTTANSGLPAQHMLAVRYLSVNFYQQGGTVEEVRNLSFEVNRGETLAIVGESSSGKSVTSLALMRLVEQGGGCIVSGSMPFCRRNGELF